MKGLVICIFLTAGALAAQQNCNAKAIDCKDPVGNPRHYPDHCTCFTCETGTPNEKIVCTNDEKEAGKLQARVDIHEKLEIREAVAHKATTLTGCLGGSEGAYTLKRGKREIQVTSSEDLSKHVGHEVKLHGTWANAAAAAATDTAEKGAAKKGEAKHFEITSIDKIADICQAGVNMGGHHKSGRTSGGAVEPKPSPSAPK
jgi:hypothetical protein